MPTTAKLTFDEGTTTNVATNTITEDAVTKHLNRTVLNTSAGVEVAPLTDTQLRATAVPVSGTFYQATQPVSAAALPLPSGASTSANQSTGNTSLASIDTKIPAQGQALAAASVPVVLPAAQITTLTPPAAITGFATAAKQLADNHNVVVTSAPTTAVTGTFWQATQPVSLASVPSHAVTNAGTFAVQDTTNPRSTKGTQQTKITSSTSETTIATAGGAGVFVDPYRITVTNTSATGTKVTIKDSTAGTTRYVWYIAAFDTKGFSGDLKSATPQSSSNNNWTLTCTTSVADIEVTVDYVKN
jgi:hypothetical protein